MKELEIANEAATQARDVIARYYREGVAMRNKESYNLVSDADVEAEQIIARVIRETFPEHSILGEESHHDDVNAEHLWIVDPIDGTNNFAHKIPHFAVSIAYYHRAIPMCGVVLNPVTGDHYHAVKGEGAFHNGVRTSVSNEERLDQALIGVGFYYDRGTLMEATLAAVGDLFRQQIHGIRRMGTASLDLCAVGTGSFGAYFEYQLNPWDYAAGRLFVEEAGGTVTTCDGKQVPLAGTHMLATNGQLHTATQKIVAPHIPAQS